MAFVCAFAASVAYADPLPVVIQMSTAGDERSEAVQIQVGNLHVSKQVPISIAAVPCRSNPATPCTDDGSMHRTFQKWTYPFPTIVEIGQQGRDNSALGGLPAEEQRAKIEEGLHAMEAWNFAEGRPLFFTPPQSSATNDTIAILDDLDYHTYAQIAGIGTCPSTSVTGPVHDGFCVAVRLCASGSGSSCVLKTYSALSTEIDARASEGAVFVSYMASDMTQANGTPDPAKLTAYGALLDSFKADAKYAMRTFDTHYRLTRGFPLPQPAPVPPLPVIFESDDARDGLYENITPVLANAHFAAKVPLTQATVPCGPGTTLEPFNCFTNNFHLNYKTWIAQNPGMLEISQHGLTHEEHLTALTEAQQLDVIQKGLQVMQGWELPGGRPFSFAAPFSEVNQSTFDVLGDLGFHTAVKNAGSCNGLKTDMETFCDVVALCERDNNGNRVTGPLCQLRSAADLIAEVNSMGDQRGKVLIVYHIQDFMHENGTIDDAKIAAFQTILAAFRQKEIDGEFDLMTQEEYYRTKHAVVDPTPTPGSENTPVPTNTPGSNTPVPTNTPGPGQTPAPTNTPSGPTPKPTKAPPTPRPPTPTPGPADLVGEWKNGIVTQQCKTKNEVTTCKLKGQLEVLNQGSEQAPASVAQILMSDDAVLDAGDQQIATASVKSLKGRKTGKAKLKLTLPAGVSASGKFIIGVIDANGQVNETDETNNVAVSAQIP